MRKHPLSQSEIRKHINDLKSLNLIETEIDKIKAMLVPLWTGYSMRTPFLRPGLTLYRGVKVVEKPSKISRISYPPKEKTIYTQRANRAGEPRFYCSVNRKPIFCELELQEGDYIVISRWKLHETILVGNVGYARKVFEHYQSERSENDIWWLGSDSLNESPENEMIHNFFAEEFSKMVLPGHEYLYKISTAIAEGLFGKVSFSGDLPVEIKDPPKDRRMGGLLYPSFAMKANIDNLALLPEFVDDYLMLERVEFFRIDQKVSDFEYKITLLDFAISTEIDGSIEWKERMPTWSGNEEVAITEEDGHKVVRRLNGELILRIVEEDGQEIARNAKGEIVEPC